MNQANATLVDRGYQAVYRSAFWALRAWWFLTRPDQHGALVLVRDANDRVLLIRNSYQPLWSVPGGTVNRGEQPGEAAARELREEMGVSVKADQLIRVAAITLPFRFRRDHVDLFEWRPASLPTFTIDHREVVEMRWFDVAEARTLRAIPHLQQHFAELRHGMDG